MMDDATITRLCAEASNETSFGKDAIGNNVYCGYNPLHDKAQAMDLVIALKLEHIWHVHYEEWEVREAVGFKSCRDKDLLRAICTCAAQVQQEKAK